jgi:UDP-N-acetylglucosamine--N-acetylmuramyl-(pentapeptide) pyrophosphoryl-undecaprenol N-acetylglucosamine transferase
MICRAGGATIAEAALFKVPAVFIPYPLAGNHQKENALSVARHGGAVVLCQDKLSPQALKNEIFSIITDNECLKQMSSNIRLFAKPNASERLADQVMELADVR